MYVQGPAHGLLVCGKYPLLLKSRVAVQGQSWRPRWKRRGAFRGSDEEKRDGGPSLGIPCFVGTTMESEKLPERQEEDGENVLPWKPEEEGVPRGRE